jgi:hypothetical protein
MVDHTSSPPLVVIQQDGSQPLADERLQKNSGWKLYFQTVIARAYPRLIGQQREKSWLFFDIFLPLLSVFAYLSTVPFMHLKTISASSLSEEP